jgi:chloramphenicol-sensitive protein RarD
MSMGVALSLTASTLFAVLYYYASLLSPLDGEQIFGWRLLLTLPVLTALILVWGEWRQVTAIAGRLRHEPGLWLVLPLSAALLGVQLWLFMWAPLHDKALDVSLGYFMLPLGMLLAGRLFYRERLSRPQKLAALSAACGVAHGIYQAGGFSWAALVVAFGYPAYFVVRRTFHTDRVGGLWFDMLLCLPLAYWFAVASDPALAATFAARPTLYLLIPLLGLISSLALAAYVLSSRYLNLSLFGLLGYVEPVLLVVVALLLGERIAANQWLTYIPIWLAVALLAAEGVMRLRR